MTYPCAFGCKAGPFATFGAARAHVGHCPERKRRMNDLGMDLAFKVEMGRMKLEEAERIQATRPKLVL